MEAGGVHGFDGTLRNVTSWLQFSWEPWRGSGSLWASGMPLPPHQAYFSPLWPQGRGVGPNMPSDWIVCWAAWGVPRNENSGISPLLLIKGHEGPWPPFLQPPIFAVGHWLNIELHKSCRAKSRMETPVGQLLWPFLLATWGTSSISVPTVPVITKQSCLSLILSPRLLFGRWLAYLWFK